jgi:hypothetical protein
MKTETKYETAERILVNNRGILFDDFKILFLKEHPNTTEWMVERYYTDIIKFTKQHAAMIEESFVRESGLIKQLEDYQAKERLERQLKDVQKRLDEVKL